MPASVPSLHLLLRAGLPLESTPVLPEAWHSYRPTNRPSFLSPKPTPKGSNLSLLLTSSLFCGQKGGQLESMAASS